MSEITNIRPWTHVHFTTKQTEYQIDVHRDDGIEPDEWYFGTNKEMWEQVIAAVKATIRK